MTFAGCSIGVKSKVTVVYVTLASDKSIKGGLRVATNRPIPVTIVGNDKITTFNAGGYYIIHETDLRALLK